MLSADFSKTLAFLQNYLHFVTLNIKYSIYLYYKNMYIPKVRQFITSESRIALSKSEKSLRARTKKAQEMSNVFQKKILKVPSGTISMDRLHRLRIFAQRHVLIFQDPERGSKERMHSSKRVGKYLHKSLQARERLQIRKILRFQVVLQ